MITILAEVLIDDFEHFINVFSSAGRAARKKHKSLESRVFKVENDPTRVFILFKWESREDFEGFLSDAEVKQTMKASSTIAPPKFIFLEAAVEFAG